MLAENNQVRRFPIDQGFQNPGNGQGRDIAFGLHQDAAVAAKRERGAQLFLTMVRADGYGDDFFGPALLFQAHRLFHGDLAKRIHRHFRIGQFHAAAVGFDANLDIGIDDAFDGDKNFHRRKNPGRRWNGRQ